MQLYLKGLGRLEQSEGSFLLKEIQLLELLTFPSYTPELTGAMWVKFLLKETTTNSKIFWITGQSQTTVIAVPQQVMKKELIMKAVLFS